MAGSSRAFGELLTQGLKSIAAHEHKSIIALEEELGNGTGVTRWSIEKWRQGAIPSNIKNTDYLAHACVRRANMDKQWLVSFLTQARFPEKEVLVRELFPEKVQPSSALRRNLPRRPYEQFVGREEELAQLEQFLSPRHRMGVVCLIGIGGVGKTALVLEAAHRKSENYTSFSPDERFEAIVWVTAKQTELLPAGIMTRNPTFTDLSDLYRAIAEVLDLPAITRALTLADREVIVAQALAERRVLLILDNLEDIDDPALMVFLRDLPAPSKAIVTTRHRIDVAIPIQVRHFNESEARELIHVECQRHNLVLTPEQAERLLRRIGYLPLAIVRTLGRMAWRNSNIEVELRQLGNLNNDIYEFCFGKSIAIVQGKDPHKLFMALALFSKDATRDALGHVAGFKEAILDRDEAISELEVLSLVNKESTRFCLEPLTKLKAQAELSANPEFEQETRERWVEWYKLFVDQIEDPARYNRHKIEASNLKSVTDWLIKQKRMDEAGWFFRHTRKFFFSLGRWGVLVRHAEHLLTWAEIAEDTELLTDILKSLTNVFLWEANFARSKILQERIQHAAQHMGDEVLLAEVRLSEVKILCRQSPCSQEEFDTTTQVLQVFRNHNKTKQVVETLKTLGNLHLKLKNFEEAARFYQEGLQLLEASTENGSPSAKRLRAALRGNLAHVAGHQGQFAGACKVYQEILKDFTDPTDLAEAYASLALYEYHQGHTQQAQQFRRKADEYIKQVNMTGPICAQDEEWSRHFSPALVATKSTQKLEN